ncbi:MAG: arsenate reductase ArsC [Deltaproteobacteria bacterium]|nr:arsenate reductase ArsC [Deltaproteobacteria bacterium]TLN01897.1 MAG: arsenate reductase ArsC [bacterium]
MKIKVLFLCTANSCRSQMAEGIANHFLGDQLEAFSAGTEASFVNPRAIAVLKEIGIDISQHRSKNLDEFFGQNFAYVITLCGDANEKCPLFFGGVRRTHLGFSDPAKATGDEEEILTEFRKVRDEIKITLIDFFGKEFNERSVSR